MHSKISLDLDYFENIVLYKILTDSSYLNSIIDKLDEKYIHNKDNKIVYNLIKLFFKEKNKIPNASELKQYLNTQELKDSFANSLNRIKNIDKNISNDELYQNTDRFLKERGISTVVWEYAQKVSEGKIVEPTILLEQVEKVCNISINTDMGLDLFNETDKIINYLSNPNKHISTGWKWLDTAIRGGWLAQGNALYTVYGKPNIGKSIVLGNLADNVAKQGYTVLLITLEMNEMSYAERLLSRITQIKNTDLMKDVDLFKQKIEENKKGRILIKEFGTSTITPFELESYIEKIQKSGIKIDFIVIDYLDLLVWPTPMEDWKALTKIAERLRGMSKKLQIPVLSASQIARQGYDETPDMKYAGGTTGINKTGDVIIGVSRNEEDIEMGVMRSNLMKNREGPKDVFKLLKIDFDTLNIIEDDTLDQIEEHEEHYNMFEKMNELI